MRYCGERGIQMTRPRAHKKKANTAYPPGALQGPRWGTRLDRFEAVWPLGHEWLTNGPTATAKELFQRLQACMPGLFTNGEAENASAPCQAVANRNRPSTRIGGDGRGGSSIPVITGLRRKVEVTGCGKHGKPDQGSRPCRCRWKPRCDSDISTARMGRGNGESQTYASQFPRATILRLIPRQKDF